MYCPPGSTSGAGAILAKCSLTSQWELTTGDPVCNSVTAVCPPGAEKTPGGTCRCSAGFSGQPFWDPVLLQWNGTCLQVAYPAISDCQAPGDCSCPKTGYAGDITWNSLDQTYVSTCEAVPCPPATGGFPNCTCLYGGTIAWDADSKSWNE